MNLEVSNDTLVWGLICGGASCITYSAYQQYKAQAIATYAARLGGDDVVMSAPLRLQQDALLLPVRDSREEALAASMPAYIKEMERTTLTLQTDPKPGKTYWDTFPVGGSVIIEVKGGDAVYRFETRVLDRVRLPSNLQEFHVTVMRPRWLVKIQRRSHKRTALALPTSIELLQGGANTQRAGLIDNLSEGGFSIRVGEATSPHQLAETQRKFPPGATLRLRIDLPNLPNSLLARVCAAETIVVRGGLAMRLGCAFLSPALHEQEAIVRYIAQLQQRTLEEA